VLINKADQHIVSFLVHVKLSYRIRIVSYTSKTVIDKLIDTVINSVVRVEIGT